MEDSHLVRELYNKLKVIHGLCLAPRVIDAQITLIYYVPISTGMKLVLDQPVSVFQPPIH